MPAWTFIRHGQSLANAQGWFAGQRDAPLTDLGREQASIAAAQVEKTEFDRALCSDLSRAHDTALRILKGRNIPLQVTPALRERGCGSWEGRPIAELEAEGVMPQFAGWRTRPGAGESLRDVARRVCALFAELPSRSSTLVVSHGALMRAVLGCLDDRPTNEIGQWRPKNCEVATREVSVARWRDLSATLG
ncbi:MAG: histidine phosphatase family protein [Nannocystaceae bacterium]|nr:histidine phosphatase family protein [Nannocystaceae bacterium]